MEAAQLQTRRAVGMTEIGQGSHPSKHTLKDNVKGAFACVPNMHSAICNCLNASSQTGSNRYCSSSSGMCFVHYFVILNAHITHNAQCVYIR